MQSNIPAKVPPTELVRHPARLKMSFNNQDPLISELCQQTGHRQSPHAGPNQDGVKLDWH
jgi:hypothetical protein